MVTFPNGILKSANEKEAFPRSKRWLNPGPNTQGNAVFIPDKLMPEATSNVEDYELEDGELRVLPVMLLLMLFSALLLNQSRSKLHLKSRKNYFRHFFFVFGAENRHFELVFGTFFGTARMPKKTQIYCSITLIKQQLTSIMLNYT